MCMRFDSDLMPLSQTLLFLDFNLDHRGRGGGCAGHVDLKWIDPSFMCVCHDGIRDERNGESDE